MQVTEADEICLDGRRIVYEAFVYYMLHKPAGVISASRDARERTVLDLIDEEKRKDLFPVGRLDRDTEGLLLITNDGELAHNLLSPKKHVDKTYLVTIKESLTKESISLLESGVDIGDEKPTMPAVVNILNDKQIYLTIHEGRFHQVKRMLKAVDNEVVALKRIKFGNLILDDSILPGEYRELTPQEVSSLYEKDNDAK
jgi:16S rRNA pseudouridine516 synthase